MDTVTWKQGLTLPHDPDATEDYQFDFADLLDGDTLTDATVAGSSITATLTSFTSPGLVTFRLSGGEVAERTAGGAAGTLPSVTVTATTSSGRVQQRTVRYDVIER